MDVGYGLQQSSLVSKLFTFQQAMAAAPMQVVIPFHPLLTQITESLNFSEPIYEFLDVAKNNMRGVIRTDSCPMSYIYVGGEAGKVEESCENAAQKAVHDLMKKFKVFVEDVTSNREQMFKRCGLLYRLKKTELEGVEKEVPKIALHENVLKDGCDACKYVSVDFISVLRAMFRRGEICSTPIETIEHSPGQYTSWFTISTPNNSLGFKCVFGERCPTLAAAKQSLAGKAIDLLTVLYNIEVVDANFQPTKLKYTALLCTLERESYLTVRERVLGIKEPFQPSALLVEQDCLTPKGVAFQIPTLDTAPLPPKKHRCERANVKPSIVAASVLDIPIFFSVPAELEIVFKRLKKA